MTTVSAQGVDLVIKGEGLEHRAYPDIGSELGQQLDARGWAMRRYKEIPGWQKLDGTPWTIGYGTTSATGRKVYEGLEIDEPTARRWMHEFLNTVAKQVTGVVKVPLNQNQFDALISLVYNIGIGNFQKSTLLRYLNQGRIREAADQFLRWDKNGQTERREEERELFLK